MWVTKCMETVAANLKPGATGAVAAVPAVVLVTLCCAACCCWQWQQPSSPVGLGTLQLPAVGGVTAFCAAR
jgi:hypothetical protein